MIHLSELWLSVCYPRRTNESTLIQDAIKSITQSNNVDIQIQPQNYMTTPLILSVHFEMTDVSF